MEFFLDRVETDRLKRDIVDSVQEKAEKVVEGLPDALMKPIAEEIANNLKTYFEKQNLKLYKMLKSSVYKPNIRFRFENITTWKRIDAEKYLIKKLDDSGLTVIKSTFTGGSDIWHINQAKSKMLRTEKKGRPDLCVIENEEIQYFIEVKTNGDGIKKEQILWTINHSEYLVIFWFVNQTIIKKEPKEETK